MKTKRTLKRRIRTTKNGKLKVYKTGHRHFMRKRSKRFLNEATQPNYLTGGAKKVIQKHIPYGIE